MLDKQGMPHDSEAEWGVLALTLADPARLKELVTLPEEAFYTPLYRSLYRAMKTIYMYGRKLSLPLVRDILMERGEYDENVHEVLLAMVRRYTYADVPAYWDGYWETLLDAYHKRLALKLAEEISSLSRRKLLDSVRLVEKVRENVSRWEERILKHKFNILTGKDLLSVLERKTEINIYICMV